MHLSRCKRGEGNFFCYVIDFIYLTFISFFVVESDRVCLSNPAAKFSQWKFGKDDFDVVTFIKNKITTNAIMSFTI